MLIGLSAVVAVVALVLGAAYVFQRQLVYLPTGGPLPAAADVLPGGRDVTLRTADDLDLGAWFLPVPESRGTVLVAPGNGGDRSMRAPLARALAERGLSVLLLDYRGYGGNPGSPSEEGLALDVRAAHDFLVREAGIAPDELVYYGESLGCGVVAELATERPPAAMVLRSPFTELAAVGQRHYPFLPVKLLLRDRFPVTEHVSASKAPLTVVYGTADAIVPPELSREVAAAGAAKIVEVPGAGHNDLALLAGDRLIDAVDQAAG
ncbi:hypothetical protein SAMN05216266_101817 [Amycolatopsis marina]|uniref:Serine aminopeptidase S33 domain-containing protein n=1 Tax=Amycolatopsis marina TaxID=490629 RepID=A0A1I0W8Z6_9PSEU|nr:hypothetical protein SAMN05216266_101817 [Amycolatopsis marina]